MPAQFKLCHHQPRQYLQSTLLVMIKPARDTIHHTKCAKRVTVWCNQWRPCVKSDFGLFRNQRVIGKSWVLGGVFDDKQVILQYCMRAKCDFTRGLFCADTYARFEPLPVFIN